MNLPKIFVVALALAGAAGAAEVGGPVRPLANDFVTVYESPSPTNLFCYTPGLARLESGRLVATLDLGGPGLKKTEQHGRIFTSDDHGKTWTPRGSFPFIHARPFVADKAVYILGHSGDLHVIRSDDGGQSWSPDAKLTEGQAWHQSACNVIYANGCVYLVMERHIGNAIRGWPVGELAPVLLRGKVTDDLTKRENWTFASELSFRQTIPQVETDPAINFFGVPFFSAAYPTGSLPAPHRNSAPLGWLETNVVQIHDPDHYWYDPQGHTFHLWARAHTGGTGYAAIAKVVENADGTMTTQLETVPSGKKILYVPCPGGQMRFHVLYDEPTKLYWLLSTQATDSMTRADRLGPDRFNLPNNERHRLQLHFSKNMVDWCFAGLVATGNTPKEARHYASMIVDGDDLQVLSRSGDARSKSAHDGNLITLHTIRNFRKLVY
ncbi:MAG: sialidase family protein [Kiritimatiellaeota bacterium]|nr:sialidase family protein [Kiritimatiellota bacterium]